MLEKWSLGATYSERIPCIGGEGRRAERRAVYFFLQTRFHLVLERQATVEAVRKVRRQ